MSKKNVIISYKNLTPEVQEIMNEQYPDGYYDDVIKVDKGNNSHFYAVIVETEEVKYLVKVDVKIDHLMDEPERKNGAKKAGNRSAEIEFEAAPINEAELVGEVDDENEEKSDENDD